MRRWRLVTFALMTATLLLVACGEDDDGGNDNGTAAAGSTTAASGEAIKLGFSAWPGWFPWQVAEEAGIFDEAGVNVELVWFEGYLDSINALAAGQLDANSQTLNDTITSVAAGSDQVIVLTNDNSTGNDQIIAAEDIKTIEDLRGKRIGVEAGVVDHYLLLLGLESAGMTADDVQIENLETGAASAAFASGQLDAVAVFAPFTTQALEREGSHTLFDSSDFPGSIPDHLVVSRELIDERPEDLQKLVNAWFMTLDYIEDNPDEAIAIMAERAGVSAEDYESYDAGTTLFSIDDNVAAFESGDERANLDHNAQEITAFLLETELIEEEPDLSKLLDPRFITAYAEAN